MYCLNDYAKTKKNSKLIIVLKQRHRQYKTNDVTPKHNIESVHKKESSI